MTQPKFREELENRAKQLRAARETTIANLQALTGSLAEVERLIKLVVEDEIKEAAAHAIAGEGAPAPRRGVRGPKRGMAKGKGAPADDGPAQAPIVGRTESAPAEPKLI